MDVNPYISFITTIQVADRYEFLEESIQITIKVIEYYCKKMNVSYEIVVCEQVGPRTKKIVGPNLSQYENVNVIYIATDYPSPLGYTFLESYGKNAGLKVAKGKFACVINADIIFSEKIIEFISKGLEVEKFYRFATYEVPKISESITEVEEILDFCGNNIIKFWNPELFNTDPSLCDVGKKSGDIMLLDTKSFQTIGGYPENGLVNHVDTATCMVIMNSYSVVVPPKDVCIYTQFQTIRAMDCNEADVNDIEVKSWALVNAMWNNKTTN